MYHLTVENRHYCLNQMSSARGEWVEPNQEISYPIRTFTSLCEAGWNVRMQERCIVGLVMSRASRVEAYVPYNAGSAEVYCVDIEFLKP
jgi:hypothetical protein